MNIKNTTLAATLLALSYGSLALAADKYATEKAPADRSVRTATNDVAITAKVKTKLLNDPQIAGLKIDVDTRAGVVTLSGTVRSVEEMQRAAMIATEIEGVVDVVNRLTTSGA